MPTSEEDLNTQAATVDALRQEVEEAEALRVQRETDTSNDITMAQLKAEEALLRARLAQAKRVVDAEDGEVAPSNAPLDAAKAALRAAVAQQEAAETVPTKEETGEQVPTFSTSSSVFSSVESTPATSTSAPGASTARSQTPDATATSTQEGGSR